MVAAIFCTEASRHVNSIPIKGVTSTS